MPIRPENRDRHPSDPGRLRPAGLFFFVLISELFDAICWEISVESGSTDFQLVDDITDEWIIFCVFEHRFSMLDGLFIHCPWAAAPATAFVGSG